MNKQFVKIADSHKKLLLTMNSAYRIARNVLLPSISIKLKLGNQTK